ncbi:MAG: hypothetical protein OEU26_06160 [Candidatus Tectomicrobia bacterium]|nr:hypothetical protein [Candidatus Tectomicrobia bacterium]
MLDTIAHDIASLTLKWAMACAFSFLFAMPSEAGGELERLTVVALAPVDGRAVIKLPDGEMQVVQPGDQLLGDAITVVQVLTDKLVVEEHLNPRGTPALKRLAWVYQAPVNGGYSHVVRLQQQAPVSPYAPLSAGRTIPLTQP